MAKLTDIQLRAWIRAGKPVPGKADGGGLTFTLSKSGTASWTLRYRIGGKQRELTLGNYPDLSLTEARKRAAAERVRASKAELVLDVHWNPNARHREIWFRDLDGYTVVLASHVESEPRSP